MKLSELLSKEILGVLDDNDVFYDEAEHHRQNEEYTVEIAFTTPRGGDENHIVAFNDYGKEYNDEEFCSGLEDCYNAFDINEYVTMWLQAKATDQRICPLDAVELVEEAQWIDEFLHKLYLQANEALRNIKDKQYE